jgi:toxin ParE1/3/4
VNVRLLGLAELEAVEAAIWYDDQRAGLGDEFLNALRSALKSISETPLRFGKAEFYQGSADIRRCLLPRFPYLVIFHHHKTEIIVLAISHVRRRPLYWLELVL